MDLLPSHLYAGLPGRCQFQSKMPTLGRGRPTCPEHVLPRELPARHPALWLTVSRAYARPWSTHLHAELPGETSRDTHTCPGPAPACAPAPEQTVPVGASVPVTAGMVPLRPSASTGELIKGALRGLASPIPGVGPACQNEPARSCRKLRVAAAQHRGPRARCPGPSPRGRGAPGDRAWPGGRLHRASSAPPQLWGPWEYLGLSRLICGQGWELFGGQLKWPALRPLCPTGLASVPPALSLDTTPICLSLPQAPQPRVPLRPAAR